MTEQLNEPQKRHLLVTFEHIDNLLAEALRALVPSDPPSPLERYQADSLPIQRKVISDYVAHLRGIMVRVLDETNVAIPGQKVSSIWAFRTTLVNVRTALAELAPRYMKGYGALPEDVAHDLEVAVTQLMGVVDRMASYLSEGAGQDLRVRLEQLEKSSHEAAWIKTLEEIIGTQGLVELRPPLAALIDRLEDSHFEVAVFGRVNSGKSSLLNYILGTDILPVGVTPITALPTRIVFGPRPLATVWFAEGRPITIEPVELELYVTEQANPDNARHVARVQVELPADRLKDGVTFVDTPGLGSLARYGETETLAYLPRCDLGIVLVDATSTLNHEDILTVNALLRGGITTMALLTKSDVLSEREQVTASRYLQTQLRANLGTDVPVAVISVKEGSAELCDRWIAKSLILCLEEHRSLAEASLRRKTGLLREATAAALRRRLDEAPETSDEAAVRSSTTLSLLSGALAKLEAARWERSDWQNLQDRILDGASAEVVEHWREKPARPFEAGLVLASCGTRELNRTADSIAMPLARLRQDLADALGAAARLLGSDHEEEPVIPAPSGMPLPDFSAVRGETPLRRPRLALLTGDAAIRKARRELATRFGPKLGDLLNRHVRQLEEWRLRTLAEMRQFFTARAGLYRVRCEQASIRSNRESVERDLERLQALENDGGKPCPS